MATQQPKTSYKDWLAKRGPKARTSTAANRDAWRKQMGLPAINAPKPQTGLGTNSPSTPASPPQRPDPWNPTLDFSGVQDETDITNTYNQNKIARQVQNRDRLADIERDRTQARENWAQQMKDIAVNAASRGLGRSGIREANDTRANTQAMRTLDDLDTARRNEETAYRTDLGNLDANLKTALGRNLAASGQREQQNYNDLVTGGILAPNPDPNTEATSVYQAPTVKWVDFVKSHARPTNPAQWAALRAKYLKRFGNG